MSCLDKRLGSRRKKTHRPHKHTGGFGNNLGIGSLMDETDREVSSLTDRAFKSLCVDEAAYSEPELTCSPAEHQQAFTEYVQSTGVLRKKKEGSKQQDKASEGKATFCPPPGDLAKMGHDFWNVHAPHLSNGMAKTAWTKTRNNSELSSVVNAFNTAGKNSKSNVIMDMVGKAVTMTGKQTDTLLQSWDKSALLSIQKELSEFSSAGPQNFSVGPFAPTKETSDGKPCNADVTSPLTKLSKSKSRKSSRHKKLSSKNFFLHSEFSPFQSWRECNRFPCEHTDMSNILPTNDFTNWYDSSLYKELKAEHKVVESVDGKFHNEPIENAAPVTIYFPKNQCKDLLNQKFSASSEELQKIEHIEKSKGINNPAVIGNGCSSSEDLRKVTGIDIKTSADVKVPCPPWRRNRGLVKKAPTDSRPCTAPAIHKQSGKGKESASDLTAVPQGVTSFNISHLLTPTIHSKQDAATAGALADPRSFVDLHLSPLSEAKVRPDPEVKLRDKYKAMASSLLFNIKDNRKRVKSMYSPTKFQNLDAADTRSVARKTTGLKQVPPSPKAPGAGVSAAVPPKAGDVKSVSSAALEQANAQTCNHKKPAESYISDDYLTLSSPRTVKEAGSLGSLPGAGHESTQASSADLHGDRSLSTSNGRPSNQRQDTQVCEPSKTGEGTRSGPPTVPCWSTMAEEEVSFNGIDISRRTEAPVKDVKQLNHEIIKNRCVQKQDLDVNKDVVSSNNERVSAKSVAATAENGEAVTGNRLLPSEMQEKVCADRTTAVTCSTQQQKNTSENSQGRVDVKRGLYDGRERDPRQEARAKHVFSTRQNQYIKNERYAMKDNAKDEQAGAEQPVITVDGNVKDQVLENQENRKAKQNALLSEVSRQGGWEMGDMGESGPRNDATSIKVQSDSSQHVLLVNGNLLNKNKEPASIEHEEVENQRERCMTSTVHSPPFHTEVRREREGDLVGRVFPGRFHVKHGENDVGEIAEQHPGRESAAMGNNKAEFIYAKEKYLTERDGLSKDRKDHNKENKHSNKEVIKKGNVKQKVLSYTNQEALIKHKASATSKIQQTKEGKLLSSDKDRGLEGVVPMAEKVSGSQKDRACQFRDRGEKEGLFTGGEGKVLTEKQIAGEEMQISNNVSASSVKEVIRVNNRKSEQSVEEKVEVKGRIQGQGSHTANRLSVLALPVQTGDVIDTHTAHVRLPAEPPSYLPLEGDSRDKDIKVENSPIGLHKEEGQDVMGKDRIDFKNNELQYYAVNNHESEKEADIASPQTGDRGSCSDGGASPSELEEGGWIRYLISSAKAQAQPPQGGAVLSPVEKPILFKVKDNTFRHSPVIRTVKLPFYHPIPEEMHLVSPKGSWSGSERGDDETPMSHGAGLTTHPSGHKSPRSAMLAAARECRQSQFQHFPILEEEPGTLEERQSGDTKETTARVVPTGDLMCSEEPSEKSDSACSVRDTPQSKPPVVPLKTEKALRRAQKLTRRIRKAESQTEAQNNSGTNVRSSSNSSAVSSTDSRLPRLPAPTSEQASPQWSDPGPLSVVPSYSMTQRKLLQDPDSGQYFVVDMPMQVKTKTFFDPETRTYIQLPVQTPEKAASPATSSSTSVSADAFSPTYMLYHGFMPVPLGPLSTQWPAGKVPAPVGATANHEKLEHSAPLQQGCGKQNDIKQEQKYVEPGGSHDPLNEESLHSEDKDSFCSENMDIISLGELDDFAMENS